MQALHQTPVLLNGMQSSLLNQVGVISGVISGVSGGSMVAAYYAAFGAETFERFESDFLRKNFRDSLISFALKPGIQAGRDVLQASPRFKELVQSLPPAVTSAPQP